MHNYTGTSGKLVLTTTRIRDISSLSLSETAPDGSSRLIPLTKCSNAFITDYHFKAGTFHYQIHGVDTNGVNFVPQNFNRSGVVRPGSYTLRPKNATGMAINYNDRFRMEFELQSNETFGTTDFTLSASANGFMITIDSGAKVQLFPKQIQMVILSGRVASASAGGGRTHEIVITANNGCVELNASRLLTVRALVGI